MGGFWALRAEAFVRLLYAAVEEVLLGERGML